jgi:hypothetical protein
MLFVACTEGAEALLLHQRRRRSRCIQEEQMYTGAANLKVWAAVFVGAPAAAVAAALVVLAAAIGLFAVLAGTAQPSRAADTGLICFGRQATITGSEPSSEPTATT